MSREDRDAATGELEPMARFAERVAGLFAPRKMVPADQELAAAALKDQFLVSFPVLTIILVLRLALGMGLTETVNLSLVALITANLGAVCVFRSGRVYAAGAILTFALWAGGSFLSWTHPSVRESLAIVVLFPALLAFLILPWRASVILSVMSIGSILVLQLGGAGHPLAGSQTDRVLALVGSLVAVGNLALVVGMRFLRTLRQVVAARKALASSNEELASILQRTPDIIYRLDLDGRVTFVNEAVRRYGHEPSAMLGTSVFDYLHPADRELARERFNRWRCGGVPEKAAEMRFLTATGRERVAEYTAARVVHEPVFLLLAEPVYDNSTGSERFVGIQGIARDVTDRKRTEEALRVSEDKYSKVFHTTPAGIAISTMAEGRFLDVNEAFERIHGYRHDEIVGRTSLELGIWADPREREHVVGLLNRNEPAENLEIHARTRNAQLRTLRLSAHLIVIAGINCILSTVEDITDHKRLQSELQQAQKLEAIGRLAGGIAHDFNNMLTVILGRAEMATGALTPESPLFDDIKEIRRAAERSSELTHELLTFARKQEVAPRLLNVNEAISERLGMLRRLIGENVALQWNPGPGPSRVKMDPVQIDRILVNLAVNARDAISDVGTLTISTENRLLEGVPPQPETGRRPGEWVVITVTDTGTGMSPETLAHIFEPFFTTKETGKGTGMGLATVYGTVEHSGGWIEVESEAGKGTTFRVYLPRTDDVPDRADNPREDLAAGGQETILVVEDEVAILKFVSAALRRQGYAVVEAGTVEDALLLAPSLGRPLHLLLTDLVMPRMNGRALHEKIAALQPGIRVILMSGYSADLHGSHDPQGEDLPFLRKPFSVTQLLAKVREVLDKGDPGEDLPGKDG